VRKLIIMAVILSFVAFPAPGYAGVDLIGNRLWDNEITLTGSNSRVAGNASACMDCHKKQQNSNFLHQPYAANECEKCHLRQKPGNKQHGDLRKKVNDLCRDCHKQDGYNHPLEKAVMTCLSCHQEHTGDNPKRLRYATDKLCLNCHEEDV